VFLGLYISLVGGDAYAYMCGFLVDSVRLCWICVLVCIYICVSFSILYYVLCFCAFVVGGASLTPNEDIVRFRCGGGSHIPFSTYFREFFKVCVVFFWFVLGLFMPL